MNTDSRTKLIERIKKLFEVTEANGATEAEAIQAALLAQRLIADNDVSQSELHANEKEEVKHIHSAAVNGEIWRSKLAKVVADNFRCRIFIHVDRSIRYHTERNYVFVGYESDAQAAKLVYERLSEICKRLASKAAREARALHGTSRGVKAFFAYGFCEGVRAELEKQCQALMLIVPQEVEAEYSTLNLKKAPKHRVYADDQSVIDEARENGAIAGRDAIRAGRINANDAGASLLMA